MAFSCLDKQLLQFMPPSVCPLPKQTSPALTEIATLLLVLCAVGRVYVDWWLIGCGWLRDTAQATAKSAAGIETPTNPKRTTRARVFFCAAQLYPCYDGLGRAASRLAGFFGYR